MPVSLRRSLQEETVTTDDQAVDLTEATELDDLVRELDAILEAWFMGEVTPALDEARRARQAPSAEAA
jgi:dTDP-4-dehydrorhamnose reductase